MYFTGTSIVPSYFITVSRKSTWASHEPTPGNRLGNSFLSSQRFDCLNSSWLYWTCSLFFFSLQSMMNAFDRDAISGWGAVVHVVEKDKVDMTESPDEMWLSLWSKIHIINPPHFLASLVQRRYWLLTYRYSSAFILYFPYKLTHLPFTFCFFLFASQSRICPFLPFSTFFSSSSKNISQRAYFHITLTLGQHLSTTVKFFLVQVTTRTLKTRMD